MRKSLASLINKYKSLISCQFHSDNSIYSIILKNKALFSLLSIFFFLFVVCELMCVIDSNTSSFPQDCEIICEKKCFSSLFFFSFLLFSLFFILYYSLRIFAITSQSTFTSSPLPLFFLLLFLLPFLIIIFFPLFNKQKIL